MDRWGERERERERENIWRVCAAKWCVSVCSRGNLNEKTWKVANLGFVSLQVPLSYKLPITLPYPCCPRASPSNSPLIDSEILKCRPGRQQPLAHGTNFREKAIKWSLKIVQFSGTPELNLPLKVAFFSDPLLLQWLVHFGKMNLEDVLIKHTARTTQGGYVDRQVKLNNTMSDPKSDPEDTVNQSVNSFFKWWINKILFAFND